MKIQEIQKIQKKGKFKAQTVSRIPEFSCPGGHFSSNLLNLASHLALQPRLEVAQSAIDISWA